MMEEDGGCQVGKRGKILDEQIAVDGMIQGVFRVKSDEARDLVGLERADVVKSLLYLSPSKCYNAFVNG
jgi:hypothetical protein